MKRIAAVLLIASLLVFAGDVSAFEPLFYARIDYGAGDEPHSVFAVDLDGDGYNDLAVANWGSANVSVLLNNGDGMFQQAVNYGAGNRPWSVFAADLDGDGDNDLAVANEGSDNVSILINLTTQTDVDDHVTESLPICFNISQNYPNPFNASTLIQYSLTEPSDVSIEIYDILGRKIETLFQAEQQAGYHQVIWDAEDASSGMYFYRIQAGDYSEAKKMLLLK